MNSLNILMKTFLFYVDGCIDIERCAFLGPRVMYMHSAVYAHSVVHCWMQWLLGTECLCGTMLLQAGLLRRLAGLQTLHLVSCALDYYYCTALDLCSPAK